VHAEQRQKLTDMLVHGGDHGGREAGFRGAGNTEY
jgi:hypothetical protein